MTAIAGRWREDRNGTRRRAGPVRAREHRRVAFVFSALTICSFALAPDTLAQISYGSGVRSISVTFFPDGKRLIETYADGNVRIVSVPDGQEIDSFKASEKAVIDVSVTADGARLATASGDGTITIWSTSDWSKLLTLEGHTKIIRAVTFSPDAQRIASAGVDLAIRLWDAASGTPISESKSHSAYIYDVTFSPDGALLASTSEDASAKVWDGRSGREIAILKPLGNNVGIRVAAFSPDSRLLAVGNYSDTYVWEIASKAMRYKTAGSGLAAAFSPDGKRLALASREGIVVADASNGKTQSSYTPEELSASGNIVAAAVSPDWKWFALLPDHGSVLIEKTELADIQTAQEDCQWEEPRDPLCLGPACADAQILFKDGYLTLTNTSARRMSVVAKFSCGSSSSLYVAAGQSEMIPRMATCVQSRSELMGLDIEFAKDSR